MYIYIYIYVCVYIYICIHIYIYNCHTHRLFLFLPPPQLTRPIRKNLVITQTTTLLIVIPREKQELWSSFLSSLCGPSLPHTTNTKTTPTKPLKPQHFIHTVTTTHSHLLFVYKVAPQCASNSDPTPHANFSATTHPNIRGNAPHRHATFNHYQICQNCIHICIYNLILIIHIHNLFLFNK